MRKRMWFRKAYHKARWRKKYRRWAIKTNHKHVLKGYKY